MEGTQVLDPPALEAGIRLGAFVAIFGVIACWEVLAPRRAQSIGRWRRWPHNLGIALLNAVLMRMLFPTAALGVAYAAESHHWGLLHSLDLPRWLAIAIAVVMLDFAIYLQHVVFHFVPALWRLHRLHHSDTEFDVTTGVRFHPIEMLLSLLIKLVAIAALGAPVIAVFIFEVLLNATSVFNHGNIRMSPALDRILRFCLVTPDMHRVHHSAVRAETNSSFGFNLTWWDRLLGTYRAQPAAGYLQMTIGLEQFREDAALRLDLMLLQPFVTPVPPGHEFCVNPLRLVEVQELREQAQNGSTGVRNWTAQKPTDAEGGNSKQS